MAQYRNPPARSINGIIVLDKPLGMSSNRALQTVKRLINAKKAGHTGALDPEASGVLPLCLGEATKFSQFLLDSDKAYKTTVQFGVRTDSADGEGNVIAEQDASSVAVDALKAVLSTFTGPISQVPPMYSALKHKGQPLYKLARQGKEVERKARDIEIYSIDLLEFVPGARATASILVRCSKGTYIRTLAEDIGEALGVGAHVSALHRTQAGPFSEQQSVSIAELEQCLVEGSDVSLLDRYVLAADAGILHLPAIEVSDEEAVDLRLGRKLKPSKEVRKGLNRVILRAAFIGIADWDGEYLAPKRLVVS